MGVYDSSNQGGWITGAPDFERPLDADKKNTYEVQVTVCDSKGGCASQKLTVALTNVSEDSDGDGVSDALEIQREYSRSLHGRQGYRWR